MYNEQIDNTWENINTTSSGGNQTLLWITNICMDLWEQPLDSGSTVSASSAAINNKKNFLQQYYRPMRKVTFFFYDIEAKKYISSSIRRMKKKRNMHDV